MLVRAVISRQQEGHFEQVATIVRISRSQGSSASDSNRDLLRDTSRESVALDMSAALEGRRRLDVGVEEVEHLFAYYCQFGEKEVRLTLCNISVSVNPCNDGHPS